MFEVLIDSVKNIALASGFANVNWQQLVMIAFERASVGHIGIDAFFKRQALLATQVVTAPVAGASGALAPVLLHIGAVHHDLGRRGLVEAREVAAQHNEVSTHG